MKFLGFLSLILAAPAFATTALHAVSSVSQPENPKFTVLQPSINKQAVWNLPGLDAHKVYVFFDLLKNTRVGHNLFTVQAPKGWSGNPVGESGKAFSSITLTPSKDLENSKAFFAIHAMKSSYCVPLDDWEKASQVHTPGRKRSFQTWNGTKWYLESYTETRGTQPNDIWVARANHDGIHFLALASTPITETESHSKKFQNIFSSIQFRRPKRGPASIVKTQCRQI